MSLFCSGMVSTGFFYYESIKRELNRRRIYKCRCEERLKAKAEGSTRLTYTGRVYTLEYDIYIQKIQCFILNLSDNVGCYPHTQTQHGLGGACNMTVCAPGSDCILSQHIHMLTPGLPVFFSAAPTLVTRNFRNFGTNVTWSSTGNHWDIDTTKTLKWDQSTQSDINSHPLILPPNHHLIVAHRHHLTRPRRTRNSNNLGLTSLSLSPPLFPTMSPHRVRNSEREKLPGYQLQSHINIANFISPQSRKLHHRHNHT